MVRYSKSLDGDPAYETGKRLERARLRACANVKQATDTAADAKVQLKEARRTIRHWRNRAEKAEISVTRLLRAIDGVGVGMFGPSTEGRTWRDAKAEWWVKLVDAVKAAEAEGKSGE